MQIAIINLFATLEYRFPNMVKAVVRRESVRKAYEVGITAEQVQNNRAEMYCDCALGLYTCLIVCVVWWRGGYRCSTISKCTRTPS